MTMPEKNADTQNILVLDDESAFVTQITAYLWSRGFSVTGFADAREALAYVETHPIAVALIDQRMPGMKGVEVLKLLREGFPDMIRVLITGYTDLDAVIQAINEGAVHRYISKKSLPEEITLVVGQCLQQHAAQQEIKRLSTANRRLLRTIAAEQGLSVLGIFGAEVARRMKDIIMGISSYLFRNAGSADPERTASDLRYLESALDRIRELAGLVEKYARGAQPVDVNTILHVEKQRAEGAASSQGVTVNITLHLGDNLPRLDVSPDLMVRLFKEIIENAVVFSPPGTKNISIKSSFINDPLDRLIEIEVINSDPHPQGTSTTNFFAPFYTTLGSGLRSQDDLNISSADYNFSAYSHYGLGLTFAKTLACRYGGELSLQREAGRMVARLRMPLPIE